MNTILIVILGISFIFVCTSLGSAIVFFFNKKEISPRVNQIFLGFASGIMLSASVFSLIVPALQSGATYMPIWAVVALAVILGAGFIWGIDKTVPHFHVEGGDEGLPAKNLNKTGKMFLAVTIHNVPEGLSVGIAYGVALAAWTENPTAALFGALALAIGIGIQNIPEGAVVALMVKGETGNSAKGFWFGVLSGAVEPVAAVLGLFLAMQLQVVMPWALAFAAGCMIYVIAEEMIPEMKGDSTHHHGVWSMILGFALMLILDVTLG